MRSIRVVDYEGCVFTGASFRHVMEQMCGAWNQAETVEQLMETVRHRVGILHGADMTPSLGSCADFMRDLADLGYVKIYKEGDKNGKW